MHPQLSASTARDLQRLEALHGHARRARRELEQLRTLLHRQIRPHDLRRSAAQRIAVAVLALFLHFDARRSKADAPQRYRPA